MYFLYQDVAFSTEHGSISILVILLKRQKQGHKKKLSYQGKIQLLHENVQTFFRIKAGD